MTPTKDDALAILRLWRREKNLINKSMIGATLTEQYVLDTVESALTQPRETVSTPMDYDLIAPVAHYFNGDADKTKAWFETPNPNLGGVKPIDTPLDRLLKFITEQTSSQPPVDVEALKWECVRELGAVCHPDHIIDHLVSKGYLK